MDPELIKAKGFSVIQTYWIRLFSTLISFKFCRNFLTGLAYFYELTIDLVFHVQGRKRTYFCACFGDIMRANGSAKSKRKGKCYCS